MSRSVSLDIDLYVSIQWITKNAETTSTVYHLPALSAGQYQLLAEGFPIGKGYNACAAC